VVPFGIPILRAMGTPEDFITYGSAFFFVEFFSTLVMFFNSIYIAIERSQGNSKRIFNLNLIIMTIKLVLTALAIYVLQAGIVALAISTLISQLVLLCFGFWNLHSKRDVFRFSLKDVSFRSGLLIPILLVSIPIMVERSAFAGGKVVVNSMIIGLGPLVVGALGISNLISGASNAPIGGMQDATINVVAQNRGAENIRRCFNAFKAVLAMNLALSTGLFILLFTLAPAVTSLFAPGEPDFHHLLSVTLRYEVWGNISLAVASSASALLIGFGYTKLTLILNVCRIFIFRIPVLWYLQRFTDVGEYAAGVVMMISNILVGVLAVFLALWVIKKVSTEHQVPFWYKPKLNFR
jgi:Na+-driven multidrug efflux pump